MTNRAPTLLRALQELLAAAEVIAPGSTDRDHYARYDRAVAAAERAIRVAKINDFPEMARRAKVP